MIPDYHWHTSRCGHAAGSMRDFVEEARRRGLSEVGFADHVPMYWLPVEERDPGLAMTWEELPVYVGEVVELRRANPGLNIRLGLEADFIPGRERELKDILELYPLDYVIGSVHYLDGWGFDNPELVHEYERLNIDEIYRQYFSQLCDAARSGLFDIIAHPDLIKKFGHRPQHPPLDLYQQAARAFAEAGVCMEVNTAGLRSPAGEVYPAREFLKYCLELGVPVTLGSDAHRPEQVGADFDRALKLLKEVGYGGIAVFEGRKRKMIPVT